MCEILREGHKRELAAHEARGGRKKDYNQKGHDTFDWFDKVNGLVSEIELLAWKRRTEAPFILAETVQIDTDGSGIRVKIVTRRIWEDPRFNDKDSVSLCARLQQIFSDDSSFCVDKQYVCGLSILHEGEVEFSICAIRNYKHKTIRGAEIVEAFVDSRDGGRKSCRRVCLD
jgi:hypothetical protein